MHPIPASSSSSSAAPVHQAEEGRAPTTISTRVQRVATAAMQSLVRASSCACRGLQRALPVVRPQLPTTALIGLLCGVFDWNLASAHLAAGALILGAGILLRSPHALAQGALDCISCPVDFGLQALEASAPIRVMGAVGTPILAAGALFLLGRRYLPLENRVDRLAMSLPGDQRAAELRFLMAWARSTRKNKGEDLDLPAGTKVLRTAREQLFSQAPITTQGLHADPTQSQIALVMERLGRLVNQGPSPELEAMRKELPFLIMAPEEWNGLLNTLEAGSGDLALGTVIMVVGATPTQWRLFQLRRQILETQEEVLAIAELEFEPNGSLTQEHRLPPRLHDYFSLSALSSYAILSGTNRYAMTLEGDFVAGRPRGQFRFTSALSEGQGTLDNEGWTGPFRMITIERGGDLSWWIGSVTEGIFEGWKLTHEGEANNIRCPMDSSPSNASIREIGPWFARVKRGRTMQSRPMTREELSWVALRRLECALGRSPTLTPTDIEHAMQNAASPVWENVWNLLESAGIASTRSLQTLPSMWQGLLGVGQRPSAYAIRQEVARAEKLICQRRQEEQRSALRTSVNPYMEFFGHARTSEQRLAFLAAQQDHESLGSSSAPLAPEILAQIWQDLADTELESLDPAAQSALGDWLDRQMPGPPGTSIQWRQPDVLALLQERSQGVSRWVRWCITGCQWSWMDAHLPASDEDIAWILQEIRRGAAPPNEFFSGLWDALQSRCELLEHHRIDAGLLAPELRYLWLYGMPMNASEAHTLIQEMSIRSALEDWERLVKRWDEKMWEELLQLLGPDAIRDFLGECSVKTSRMVNSRFAFLPQPPPPKDPLRASEPAAADRQDPDSASSSSAESSRCSTPAIAAASTSNTPVVQELYVSRDVFEQINELSASEAGAVHRWLSDAEIGLITGERPQVVQGALSLNSRVTTRNWSHAHIHAPGGVMFVIFYRSDSEGRRLVESLMRGHNYDRDFDPRKRAQTILKSQTADYFVRFAGSC